MINVPDLYPDEAPVDETGYCILLIIKETQDHLWKRSMARELNEWRDTDRCPLNVMENISVQTICRRIDTLVENGYLEEEPVYSEDLGRYVDTYVVTEDGEQALETINRSIVNTLYVELFEHSLADEPIILKEGVLEKLGTYTTCDIGTTTDDLATSFQSVAAIDLPEVQIKA
ncbi:MAG: hypothetical protein MUP66_01375 [Candidatus Nanohaloarchaeota archaeon QJJ-5]|nr:hypothetical protein [Candidatus Nanohaloarchaeota archaeon QJJ-5]